MFLQLFGLIALIIKIIVLSTVYTTIVFLLLYLISKNTKNKWIENRMKRKIRNWLFVHFIISFALFAFSFSYWENAGLGDYPQLPIGYGQVIYSPDFAWTDFYPDLEKTELNKDELQIENFLVKDNILCAEISHKNTDSPNFDFIVCDLLKRSNKTFSNEQEYNEYAAKNNLPLKDQFYDFNKHYEEYFANRPKWRKWLLP